MPQSDSIPLFSLKEYQQVAIKTVFESIKTYGLCSLKNIPKEIPANPVTQVQNLEGHICVNYINLHGATPDESTLALETAIYEEYMGLYGISLERQWPFQRFTSSAVLKAEVLERLINSIVFILPPPELMSFKATYLPGLEKPTQLAFYNLGEDGFSQARQNSIITGQPMPYTNRVTEIKTSRKFSMKEVLAILVPEQLLEMAQEVFDNQKIISVPQKPLTIKSLPDILGYFHNEKIKAPLSVAAPDFLSALQEFCSKNKSIKRFSLHGCRLNTSFDFIIRPVILQNYKEVLVEANAKVIATQDDQAWVVVHKNYGLSKQKLIDVLANKNVPELTLQKIKNGSAHSISVFNSLLQIKGDVTFKYVYRELSDEQLSVLTALSVKIIKSEHYFAIQHLPHLNQKVEQVVDHFDLMQEESARLLQSFYKTCLQRRTYLYLLAASKCCQQLVNFLHKMGAEGAAQQVESNFQKLVADLTSSQYSLFTNYDESRKLIKSFQQHSEDTLKLIPSL